ncbi:MAG: glycosyltransferase family 2 protein [Vicinamibacteria bacterium]
MSVVVITYNSERDISRCLDSIGRQSYARLEVLIIDNDSGDRTEDIVRHHETSCRFVKNTRNIGFAAAHNQGIRLTAGELYLALNPDVELTPSFIEEMVRAMAVDPLVGSVSGKLLRFASENGGAVIDSTGIYMTPSLRHLDRGSGESDRGQYDRLQYVFGASGAAALYRRRMLDAVSSDGECFDEDFFAYREDADLAWRAQLLGWRALYTPRAIARHERRVLPERRRSLPATVNMHSVKNRFLLRIKNQTPGELLALLLPSLWRDLQVVVYVLLFERTSLPGLTFVPRHWDRLLAKRKWIQSRRTATTGQMLRWFRWKPVGHDTPMSLQEPRTSPGSAQPPLWG